MVHGFTYNIFLITFFLVLISACDSKNLENRIPAYVEVKNIIFENSDLFTCSSSAYKVEIKDYKKNIIQNAIWIATPIQKEIIEGMSVRAKTLHLGATCGDGLGELSDVFWESLEGNQNIYTYFGDNILLLIATKENLLFVFSVD